MHKLITKELAEEIRLDLTHFTIIPVEDDAEIVPEKLTHFYLINNFEIDQSIIDHYYFPTRRLISELEFRKMVERGYRGNINSTLEPYSIKMFGAYFRRGALFYKIIQLTEHNKDALLNGNEIKYFNDLEPYFKEYADGFKDGYNNFENEIINTYGFGLSDNNDKIVKVFEFITYKYSFERNWLKCLDGFTISTISQDLKANKKHIVNAFKDGKTQGYFYKAWCIVLSHSKMFQPLFVELSNQNKQKKDNQFSVLEWATIFYYADETKLLPENRFLKKRMEVFMESHNTTTTLDSFKSKYHIAKNRINKKNDFPIDKLELIIPFLKEHYNQAVIKVENDILFLENESDDYQ